MYCNKCGKEIEQGTLCPQCEAASVQQEPVQEQPQVPYTPAPTYTYAPPKQNKMFGFGKALAGTIISIVGFIFSLIGYFIVMAEATISGDVGVGLVFLLMSLPLVILPIIFGISSIKAFTLKKRYGIKLIPTLILGIVGLATAAFSAIYVLLGLLICAILI